MHFTVVTYNIMNIISINIVNKYSKIKKISLTKVSLYVNLSSSKNVFAVIGPILILGIGSVPSLMWTLCLLAHKTNKRNQPLIVLFMAVFLTFDLGISHDEGVSLSTLVKKVEESLNWTSEIKIYSFSYSGSSQSAVNKI